MNRVIATAEDGSPIAMEYHKAREHIMYSDGVTISEAYVVACIDANKVLTQFLEKRGWMK